MLGGIAVIFGIVLIIGAVPLIFTPVGWISLLLGIFFIWGGSQD
jgi:hypothetical protein